MSRDIEILRSLDRKERFAVLRETLGFDRTAPELGEGFRTRLSSCIGVPVPAKAFAAMDYLRGSGVQAAASAFAGSIPPQNASERL